MALASSGKILLALVTFVASLMMVGYALCLKEEPCLKAAKPPPETLSVP
jgi:hypothetical protein